MNYEKVTANMRKQEAGPQAVARVVQQVIETSRPKARYVAGFPFTGRLVIFLGDAVWDQVVRQMFNIRVTV